MSGFHCQVNRPEKITERFYCPLTVHIYEDDDGLSEGCEYDGSTAAVYEEEVRRMLQTEMARGSQRDMAVYYDGFGKDKLVSVRWDVEEQNGILFGVINAELTSPLSEEEKEEFLSWVVGQNSDGFGEGFEQRPLKTDEGEIYISFWHSGADYFLYDEDRFEEYLNGGILMGGME